MENRKIMEHPKEPTVADHLEQCLTALIPHCGQCNNLMKPVSKTNRRISGGRTENTLWECQTCTYMEEEVRTLKVVTAPDETWEPDIKFRKSHYEIEKAKHKAEAASVLSNSASEVM